VISFSGGVAECIHEGFPALKFGDIGPVLGQAIRQSSLCAKEFRLSQDAIRATVIGAGCHSAQLSGSTVFYRGVDFPMKNLPVVCDLSQLSQEDGPAVLALPAVDAPHYHQIVALADQIAEKWPSTPVLIALEADMAKALGHALALRLPPDQGILCIDRVKLPEGSFLDVGQPVASALPVVVKTLILSNEMGGCI
jgi:ethanolamine utilization protein EutA